MAIISFPSTLKISKSTWGQKRNDLSFQSIFGSQGVEVSPPVWIASLTFPPSYDANAGPLQALKMQLKGQTNNLALHNPGRPQPLGTMRGAMTLNANAAAGAVTLSIVASGQAAKTLVQGDMIGIGSTTTTQVVMVMADATSNGSGVISVTVEPPLRNAFLTGATITWDKPCALFRQKDSSSKWDYEPKIVSGVLMDLIEDWRL